MYYLLIIFLVIVVGAVLIESSHTVIQYISNINNKVRYGVVIAGTLMWIVLVVLMRLDYLVISSERTPFMMFILFVQLPLIFLVAFPTLLMSLDFMLLLKNTDLNEASDWLLLRNKVIPFVLLCVFSISILIHTTSISSYQLIKPGYYSECRISVRSDEGIKTITGQGVTVHKSDLFNSELIGFISWVNSEGSTETYTFIEDNTTYYCK